MNLTLEAYISCPLPIEKLIRYRISEIYNEIYITTSDIKKRTMFDEILELNSLSDTDIWMKYRGIIERKVWPFENQRPRGVTISTFQYFMPKSGSKTTINAMEIYGIIKLINEKKEIVKKTNELSERVKIYEEEIINEKNRTTTIIKEKDDLISELTKQIEINEKIETNNKLDLMKIINGKDITIKQLNNESEKNERMKLMELLNKKEEDIKQRDNMIQELNRNENMELIKIINEKNNKIDELNATLNKREEIIEKLNNKVSLNDKIDDIINELHKKIEINEDHIIIKINKFLKDINKPKINKINEIEENKFNEIKKKLPIDNNSNDDLFELSNSSEKSFQSCNINELHENYKIDEDINEIEEIINDIIEKIENE